MAAVVGMVASLATGCSDRAEVTRVIGGEYRDSTRVLVLTVSSCNADVSADVVETATEVRVTVTAKGGDPLGDCADGLEVRLDRSLDGRPVLDGGDRGRPVMVSLDG
jgi:hypothetical protein